MPEHWIAETTWIAHDVAGGREELVVRVGAPALVGPEEWECQVALLGLHPSLQAVRGHDALQALGLAWQLCGRLLHAFVEGGGRLEYPTGEPVPLDAYFGRAEPPDAHG